MKSVVPLGRLEDVPLREAWPDEAAHFTPWLAEPDNLALLAKTLDIPLQFEAIEKSVGDFSADIVAKRPDTEQWVLIENQIAPTDHKHLGQLLTYAAGLEAHIIIWIAEEFREEHRAAIDFLNRATTEEFSFFGIQIELYKIGTSAFAPRFSIVAKPNDWSKRTSAVKQASPEENALKQLSHQYWSALITSAKGKYPALSAKNAYQGNWQHFETLKGANPRLDINASFSWDKGLRVEVYISGSLAKSAFYALEQHKAEIEANFGASLEWEELPGKVASRIAYYMPSLEKRENRDRWKDQHEWMLTWAPKLASAVRPFAAALSVDALKTNDE